MGDTSPNHSSNSAFRNPNYISTIYVLKNPKGALNPKPLKLLSTLWVALMTLMTQVLHPVLEHFPLLRSRSASRCMREPEQLTRWLQQKEEHSNPERDACFARRGGRKKAKELEEWWQKEQQEKKEGSVTEGLSEEELQKD